MIEAWFEGWDMTGDGSAVDVPVLMPNDEIREIAGLVGMDDNDLFCIDIPSGASRHTRINCLVPSQSLKYLFNAHLMPEDSTSNGIKFNWRDKNVSVLAEDQAVNTMKVFLLRPRPIFQNATKYSGGTSSADQIGVVALTAVDRRYFWINRGTGSPPAGSVHQHTHDGRWWLNGDYTPFSMVPQLIDGLSDMDDAPYVDWSALNAYWSADLTRIQRVLDIDYADPQTSSAVMLDIIMALSGFVLVPRQAYTDNFAYVAVQVGTSGAVDAVASWIEGHEIAAAGGTEPSAITTNADTTYPLFRYWNAQFDSQYKQYCVQNAWAYTVYCQFPLRTTEGNTYYSNAEDWEKDHRAFAEFYRQSTREVRYGVTPTYPSGRSAQRRCSPLLMESRPVLQKNDSRDPKPYPSVPSWNVDAYKSHIWDLLKNRTSRVVYGSVALGGWVLEYDLEPQLRLTNLRYTIAVRAGQLVPITITTNDESDWLLGPDGLPVTSPSEMFVGKGLANVRRVSCGIVEIDVAPPNCRVFPARITGATRVAESGNGYWQWEYQWEEVERDPATVQPVGVNMDGYERKWNKITGFPLPAVNFAEAGNVYLGLHNSGNTIAPGILQSEYSAAWIEPAPISVGTIVMMCEHFPTGNITGKSMTDAPNRQNYWFSMPNAVKVTCT